MLDVDVLEGAVLETAVTGAWVVRTLEAKAHPAPIAKAMARMTIPSFDPRDIPSNHSVELYDCFHI